MGSPADGGRRSRRGFAYQDVVTLRDCLDLHEGNCDEVGFEDLEDIVRVEASGTVYRQVKTSEGGIRHSVSTICRPEKKDKVGTSILGRLFTKGALQDGDAFCLTVNETPEPGLGAFVSTCLADRGPITPETVADICKRLEALVLPEGITIEWCVGRFYVDVDARTIEQVEATLLKSLEAPVTAVLQCKPLFEDLEEVLFRLIQAVTRSAAEKVSRRWDRDAMTKHVIAAVGFVAGRTSNGEPIPLQRLEQKLGDAGVPLPEARAQVDALLAYRSRFRSALGLKRIAYIELNDHVHAICSQTSARRRAGQVAPGAAAYAATVDAVTAGDLTLATIQLSIAERLAALSDVTARCVNRYVDEP